MLKKVYLPDGLSREVRTKKLNDSMRNIRPGVCIERAKLVTESYKQTEGEPYILRRAKALSHILKNMTIFISDNELIVGNHASKPRWAPLFPEVGTFDKKELDLFPVRKVDTLKIDEKDKEYLLNEIYPYWKNKNTEDISCYYFSEEVLRLLKSDIKVFDPTSRTRSGYGHYIGNIEKILKHGFKNIEEEALKYLLDLSPLDPQQTDKVLFYRTVLIICEAVRDFSFRYAQLARSMAQSEVDLRRKKELEIIASVCEIVPYYPAENFHQALQSYWFTILIDYIFQNGSAISAGRFDQYMYPFYKKDINLGIITKDEAQELLEALWVKHSDIIKASKFNSAKNNGGFATTIHISLSGVDKNGMDATNELSYLCLEAERNVFNSEPNVGIRVHSATPDKLLHKVIEILVSKEGGKLPLYNDNAIIQGLCADGVPLELARDYSIVGCVEPTPVGNTMGITNACYFNLAKCLELSLNNGICMLSGEKMGLSTGDSLEFRSFEDVKEAFAKQIEYFVTMMINSLNTIEEVVANYTPHIYPSLLIDGCLEKGVDATKGGAMFNYVGVQGVGLADVADSLAAIKKLVFDENKITMKVLIDALKTNFDGKETLRQMLINHVPKYGNDVDEVDELAKFVADTYSDAVKKGRDYRGGSYRPGLFCLTANVPFGRQTAALPSGRLVGTPLADGGVSPKHGMDKNGPTAVVKSVAKLDHCRVAINGVTLNQKFLPTVLKTFEERKRLISLIKAYFSLGGFHIQFNIMGADTLKKAQQNPDDYRSLVVRVAGYSAFFVELDKDIQDEIIARTVQNVI